MKSRSLTPREGAKGVFNTTVAVAAGKATQLSLNGGKITRQTLTFAGTQTVRAIYLGAADDAIGEAWATGSRVLNPPLRARRVVLIGEGMHPPVAPAAATTASAPMVANEAIGIEHDSVLLALGPRVYAAHGCLFESSAPIALGAKPLDSVPGFKVLENATHFRVFFPAVKKGWTLMIGVRPIVADAGSAVEEIRWATLDATLGQLHTVIGPDASGLLMPVATSQPWTLDVDLGKKWRLTNLVVCGINQRDLAGILRRRGNWDFVDDRLTVSTTPPSTNVTVEVA